MLLYHIRILLRTISHCIRTLILALISLSLHHLSLILTCDQLATSLQIPSKHIAPPASSSESQTDKTPIRHLSTEQTGKSSHHVRSDHPHHCHHHPHCINTHSFLSTYTNPASDYCRTSHRIPARQYTHTHYNATTLQSLLSIAEPPLIIHPVSILITSLLHED